MKLEAFLVLANSTSAEPDVGTEMFCPFMGQKVPAFGSNTCTKWIQCPENRPGFSIIQECPSGIMFNKNTRECDENCTPDLCCLNPDTYVPPSTAQASTTAATQDSSCESPRDQILNGAFSFKWLLKIKFEIIDTKPKLI